MRFLTLIVLSLTAAGRAIKSPVRDCELMLPSISVSPPSSFVDTVTGAKPLFEETVAPRFASSFSIRDTGRLRRVPFPLRVKGFPDSAAMGVNMRIARPDSPQKRFSSFISRPPFIITSSELFLTFAPIFFIISSAAIESSLKHGFKIRLSPVARSAAATALCISLFDGGAFMVPFILEG